MPDSVTPPSHTEYQIGGLPVHVYGVSEAEAAAATSDELVVLHLVHPRTRSYEYTERMATLLLAQYRAAQEEGLGELPPVVAATFDLRNHGHRIVSKDNTDWKRGNRAHGQDMVTGILGSVQDVELVLEFLPSYLPASLTTTAETGAEKRVWNVVSGVSQGGHITWKVAAHARPDKGWNLLAAVPIIAAPDLTTMLVHRLLCQVGGLDRDAARALLEKQVFPLAAASDDVVPSAANFAWSELAHALKAAGVADAQTNLLAPYWPRTLHARVAAEDRATLASAKLHVPNLFLVNSRADPLVPSWVSYSAAARTPTTGRPRSEAPADRTLYEEEGIGHVFTNGMAAIVGSYIVNVVRDRHRQTNKL